MSGFDTLLITIGVVIALVILLYFVSDIEKGCSGDCYQGRRSCNCKGKK